jgi:hypothetical protein
MIRDHGQRMLLFDLDMEFKESAATIRGHPSSQSDSAMGGSLKIL